MQLNKKDRNIYESNVYFFLDYLGCHFQENHFVLPYLKVRVKSCKVAKIYPDHPT